MLRLPDDWNDCTAEWSIEEVLRQADSARVYGNAARAITRASLEYMMAGPRWPKGEHGVELHIHPKGLCLNDYLFYTVERVDDDTLIEVAGLRRTKKQLQVLSPPWAASLLSHGVKAILPRYPVDVTALDQFTAYKLLWTRIDLGCSQTEALTDLLQRYNGLVPDSIQVELTT